MKYVTNIRNSSSEEDLIASFVGDINLGDSFMFDKSMRAFHAMPNTRIPNDQGAFANFCYGNMPSCKEGDKDMCEKNNFRYTNY